MSKRPVSIAPTVATPTSLNSDEILVNVFAGEGRGAISNGGGAGAIVACGTQVAGLREAQRVVLTAPHAGCAGCERCFSRFKSEAAGRSDGSEQEGAAQVCCASSDFVVARAQDAVAIPEHVEPATLSLILCAGVAAYCAVRSSHVLPGQWLIVAGGYELGLLTIQYAKALGLSVVAVVETDAQKMLAQDAGATLIVGAKDGPGADPSLNFLQGGAKSIVITTYAPAVFRRAVDFVRHRGHAIVARPLLGQFHPPMFDMVPKRLVPRAPAVPNRDDIRQAIDLLVQGHVRARIAVAPGAERRADEIH